VIVAGGGRAGRVLALALAASVVAPGSRAQSWRPERPVEIVVPSAPGGSNDKTARTLEKVLHDRKLVPVASTVVNKPGGGNAMTMSYVNARPGDGHYLMIGTPTILSNHIIGAAALN